MNIQDIKRLRAETMFGISKCSQALAQSGGDWAVAKELLMKEAERVACKLASRPMKEGAIFTLTNDEKNCGVLLKLGCETDFVARTEHFMKLGRVLAESALKQKPRSKEALFKLEKDGETLQQTIYKLVGVMGENISVLDYFLLEGGLLGHYGEHKKGALVLCKAQGAKVPAVEAANAAAAHLAVSPVPHVEGGDKSAVLGAYLAAPFYKEPSQTLEAYLCGLPEPLTILDFAVSQVTP